MHRPQGYHRKGFHHVGDKKNKDQYSSHRHHEIGRTRRSQFKEDWDRWEHNHYSSSHRTYIGNHSFSDFRVHPQQKGPVNREGSFPRRKHRDRYVEFNSNVDEYSHDSNNYYGPLKKSRRSNRRNIASGFAQGRRSRRNYEHIWRESPRPSRRAERDGGRPRSRSPLPPHDAEPSGDWENPPTGQGSFTGGPFTVNGYPQEYSVLPRRGNDDWPSILAKDHHHPHNDRNPYNPSVGWVERERSLERTRGQRETPSWRRWYSPHSPAGRPLSPASPLEPVHLMQHDLSLRQQAQAGLSGPNNAYANTNSPHPELEFGLGVSLRGFARLTVCSSVATDDSGERDHVETCTIASTDVHPPSSIGNASEHDIPLSPPGSPTVSVQGFAL